MRWGLAVGGVVLIGLGVLLVTGQDSWSLLRREQRATVDAGVVRLDTGSGDVRIRRGQVDRIELVARTSSLRPTGASWDRDGDVLELQGCGWMCGVSYDLVVPPGTRVAGEGSSGSLRVVGAAAVDVELSSGSIDLRDVTGSVRASTSSGSVRMAGITGPVTADTSSGSIQGTGLAGPVDVTASSGDIAVALTRAQDVRAKTSSGDVEVAVPPGRYRITVDDSGSDLADGRYPAGIVADSSARYGLELRTSSGDTSVRAR